MPRVRIKICGMTREEDILHAVSLGVDAVGFIFFEGSRRFITPEQALPLTQLLPAFVDAVAVFVNPTRAWVDEILKSVAVQYLQFHGDESPNFCLQFGKPYIKAAQALSLEAIETIAKMHNDAAAILLDTPSAQHGGSGQVFDWRLIPQQLSQSFILAGGLTPQNVKKASLYDPFAVDVCSGVESVPGIKDHQKMSEFVQAVWGKL
jgi:phosphoribosylanthranilate isomerase